MRFQSSKIILLFLSLFLFAQQTSAQSSTKPNVIIVLTDDQGYGDLACNGNAIIKTPALDQFYKQSVRLTDFHVAPTCSPSRAGLMTGRYANRVGVWHTIGGWSILREKEVTLANLFVNKGYETALFGKWHLGDSYPSRPQDKGFKHVLTFPGGGVGQTPDFWGNDYFDDVYLENGLRKKVNGYCTDVWFDEAIKYIETNKKKPFFCYIATNAAHVPYNVPKKYYELYKDAAIPDEMKRFYGMITNFDDNFKKLQEKLKQLEILDNTIVIFMTDNGTAAGYKKIDGKFVGNNANMKGIKGSEYEGGHRVPFFISYPKKIKKARAVNTLTANIDIMPTLAKICGLQLPEVPIDGTDISELLFSTDGVIKREYVVTDSQRVQKPIKWRKSSVMSDKMRLINGIELYDLASDPSQSIDISSKFPETVAKMRGFYEEWWRSVSTEFDQMATFIVGSDKQNPVTITAHDQHSADDKIPYLQNHIREGNKNPLGGELAIEFECDGDYEIEVSRYPTEANLMINEAVEGKKATLTTSKISDGKAFDFRKAILKIGSWKEEKPVETNAKSVVFKGKFSKGKTFLSGSFTDVNNAEWAVYFYKIKRI
jgi:arylsulfatase A-like enzyme